MRLKDAHSVQLVGDTGAVSYQKKRRIQNYSIHRNARCDIARKPAHGGKQALGRLIAGHPDDGAVETAIFHAQTIPHYCHQSNDSTTLASQ